MVDNTNPTTARRAVYIALARAAGFRVTGYYFPSTVESALARNAQRVGKQQVPAHAVAATLKRLESPRPAEGYDVLYTVRIEEEGGFVVEPQRDAGF